MRYSKYGLKQHECESREKVRKVYSSKEGQDELFNLFHDFGLFRCISTEELDARNRMILKAEELGMLDEDVIREFIRYFFSLPLREMEARKVEKPNESDIYDVPDAVTSLR